VSEFLKDDAEHENFSAEDATESVADISQPEQLSNMETIKQTIGGWLERMDEAALGMAIKYIEKGAETDEERAKLAKSLSKGTLVTGSMSAGTVPIGAVTGNPAGVISGSIGAAVGYGMSRYFGRAAEHFENQQEKES
jgi:hypothetical protein